MVGDGKMPGADRIHLRGECLFSGGETDNDQDLNCTTLLTGLI